MKQIISYFPLFTVIILALGYAQMHYYYHSFGVPIEHYISINEIVLNFFPSITGWLFILSVIGYGAFVLIINRINNWDSIKPIIFFKERTAIIMLSMVGISMIARTIFRHNNNPLQVSAFYLSMVLLQYSFVFIIIIKVHDRAPHLLKHIYFKYLLLIALWGPIFQGLNTYENGYALYQKEFGNNTTVAFTYQNTIYNNSFMYIGETSDYVFMWDKTHKQSLIFPKRDITNYVIKERL